MNKGFLLLFPRLLLLDVVKGLFSVLNAVLQQVMSLTGYLSLLVVPHCFIHKLSHGMSTTTPST